jgi:hypothetical protein
MDRGVMERWGITPQDFDAAIRTQTTDQAISAWLTQRAPADRIRAANEWLLSEKQESMDRQDAEEGVTV